MPSHLRLQSPFEPLSAATTQSHFPASSPPQKKQKMSLSQTYYIAASARSKLGKEACRPDHNLRLLVGHANLLDSLMLELHDAEREQEAWFNQTVKKAAGPEEPKHIQWADTVMEEDDEDDSASEASDDSDDDFAEEDFEMAVPPRKPSVVIVSSAVEEVEDEEIYDDEYDDEHALFRTPSHSPPELIHDEGSDDESPPTSPPQLSMDFTAEQQMQTIAATGFFSEKQASLAAHEQESFIQEGFFIPERTPQLIESY